MPSIARARPESDRIEFLLGRDGYEATRTWVERTLDIYRQAVRVRGARADAYYGPLFEKSIAEFEEWLAHNERPRADAPAVLVKESARPDVRNIVP